VKASIKSIRIRTISRVRIARYRSAVFVGLSAVMQDQNQIDVLSRWKRIDHLLLHVRLHSTSEKSKQAMPCMLAYGCCGLSRP
jgi:hypothetical protein